MSLEKLFQQIYQSEQTADSRREHITNLKKQITESQAELKALKDSCSSSRGRLHVFVRQYHEEKAETTSLEQQKKVFEQRRDEILQDVESLKKTRSEKEEYLEKLRSDSTESVLQFCAQYDLTGGGARKRKEGRMEELKQLEREIKVKSESLEMLTAEEERVTELLERRELMQADVSQLQSQIIEADSLLEQKRSETIETGKKVQKFYNEIRKDPELVQLQKELHSIKNHELEQKVRNLKTELEKVKRRKWQGTSSRPDPPNCGGPSHRGFKFHPTNK